MQQGSKHRFTAAYLCRSCDRKPTKPVNDFNLSCCGRGFDTPRLHHLNIMTEQEKKIINESIKAYRNMIDKIEEQIENLERRKNKNTHFVYKFNIKNRG